MTTLPLHLTAFIGRDAELGEIDHLLRASRLLTLTGAGGSGKTRLALEAARRAAVGFPDGVAWAELASLTHEDGLVALAGAALRRALPSPLGSGEATPDALLRLLHDRRLLLVLDNCEHLLDACAVLADTLLRGCPGLTVLATSRQPLGVAGEVAWLVPPLSLPPPAPRGAGNVADSEAVQLFTARARDALPRFALTDDHAEAVAHICRRLDGIPLAIELAAARVRLLSPRQIAERLDDAFGLLTTGARTALPRQRTLRATVDWSYALLTDAERLLFERLAVFAGAFTLRSVERVCAGSGIGEAEVIDLLAALVDKSLVELQPSTDVARYRMLEAIRQYALERLEAGEAARAVRRRHAAYFAEAAEEADPDWLLPTAYDRLAWLERDQDDVRAAMAWLLDAQEAAELALRLSARLAYTWSRVGSLAEVRRWLEAALARPDAADAAAAYARALHAAAVTTWMQGDLEAARAWAQRAEAARAALEDPRELVTALNTASQVYKDVGEPEAARRAAEQCRSLARELGEPGAEALALLGLGAVLRSQGELERAEAALGEGEAICRAAGFYATLAATLGQRVEIELARGRLDEAARQAREAIQVLRGEPSPWLYARALHLLALVLARQGRHQRAARLLAAVEALSERQGGGLMTFERATFRDAASAARDALGEAFAAAWAEGRAMDLSAAVAFACEGAAPGVSAPLPAGEAASGHGQPAPVARSATAGEAPALRVLALGPLQVFRDGELLAHDAWGSARPRELLVYLLCHPEGRTREQIGLAFWPDASAAQVKNNYHVVVHRLRRGLGRPDWVVLDGERCRISPAVRVSFDAADFERMAREAARELARTGGEEAAERLRAALALYRGDFLDGEGAGDWHLEVRERLALRFEDGLLALSGWLSDRGQHAEAVEVLRRLVARDGLHEEAHRRLMESLARLGDRSQALRIFSRLSERLRDEWDAAPETETVQVYERIRQGAPG